MTNINNRLHLFSLAIFLFCMFPYVSPLPMPSDVQPLVGIFGMVIFLLHIYINKYHVSREYLFLLLFVFICSMHLSTGWENELSKIFAIYIAVLSYIGLDISKKKLSVKLILISMVLYFVFSIIMILFTSEFIFFQNYIVRNTNSVVIGYRGVSTFATEPGLLAGLIVGLLAISDHFKREGALKGLPLFVVWFSGIGVILMTRSGTGVAYLFFYLLIRNRTSLGVRTITLLCLAILLLLLLLVLIRGGLFGTDFSSLGRGGGVLYSLATAPLELLNDRSILYRLYSIFVSFSCFVENPFGVGFGGVSECSNLAVSINPVMSEFYYSFGEEFHAVSSFGYYLSALGFLFLLPFLWFLIFFRIRLDYKLLSLLYFMFSYSIAFPIIWCLISIGKYELVRSK